MASDRGQRYCVKGFGVRPLQQKPLCLSLIYAAPRVGEVLRLNTLTGSPASPRHIRPLFYQHSCILSHVPTSTDTATIETYTLAIE